MKANQIKKYPPKLFHSTDVNDAFKIAESKKFANLIITTMPDMDAVFIPFYTQFQKTNQKALYGHLVRSNPVAQLLEQNPVSSSVAQHKCQVIFNADDVYISPTCYKEKQISHNVVPTWNYVAAQFRGTIQRVPDAQFLNILKKQVQIFESSVGSKWRLEDATKQYVQLIMKSIVGIKINVQTWKSHFKLSQNKLEEIENVRKWSENRKKQELNILYWMDEFK